MKILKKAVIKNVGIVIIKGISSDLDEDDIKEIKNSLNHEFNSDVHEIRIISYELRHEIQRWNEHDGIMSVQTSLKRLFMNERDKSVEGMSDQDILTHNKYFKNIKDMKSNETGLVFGKFYNRDDVKTKEFHPRNAPEGYLQRKVGGLCLDELDNPFEYEIFGLSSKEYNAMLALPRWNRIILYGEFTTDKYHTDPFFKVSRFYALNPDQSFEDNSTDNGRYELSVHTLFSQLESTANPHESFIEAAKLGLSGIGLTDSTSAQGYAIAEEFSPTFHHVKPLFGAQFNIIKDRPQFVINPNDMQFIENHQISNDDSFVAFDLETTGVSPIYNDIIQISAVRYTKTRHERTKGRGKNKHKEEYYTYDVIDSLDQIVHTDQTIPPEIVDLTGISQEDTDKSTVSQLDAVKMFLDFIHDVPNTILIGQNVVFDYRFINHRLIENNMEPLKDEIFDTLPMARRILPNSRGYNLTALSKKLHIKLERAHNSLYDCEATGRVFFELMKLALTGEQSDLMNPEVTEDAMFPNWKTGMDVHNSEPNPEKAYQEGFPQHVDVLIKNQDGVQDLYKMISDAYVKHFYKVPRLYKSELKSYHDKGNLLLGSGDAESELYDVVMNRGFDEGLKLAKQMNYDYIEIMGFSSLGWDVNFKKDFDNYQRYVNAMVKIANETNAIPVIIGDVHHIDKKQKIVYDILHKIEPGKNKRNQGFKSIKELQEELKPFISDKKLINDLVVKNTQEVASLIDIDNIHPIHTKLTPPKLPGAEQELKETAWKRAHELYGEKLPKLIEDRINKELNSIIDNGYAVIYLTSKRMVDISKSIGYLVGSRGSVGSSFVAYLVGITEINALPPHYRSKYGDYVEFVDQKKWNDGFDLPPKEDPNHPGEYLIGDGHGCIFEIFAGVGGTKVPDIDLNFASEIQNEAQTWLRDKIFDKKHTFRVGTIGTIAKKTGFGMVKAYQKQFNIPDSEFTPAKVDYLSDRLIGIRRTIGVHAAGVLVVPEDREITEFTPYTYASNDKNSGWFATQLTKEMIHDSLLKVDVLGHDDPSVLHFIQDMTGIDPKSITQLEIRDTIPKAFKNADTVRGLPEFGTGFSSQIVQETHPKYFSDLVQISGLSHGTGVWTGNAQKLIESGQATLQTVIGSRDKIMNDVTSRGWPLLKAHKLIQIIKRHDRAIPEDMIKSLESLGLPSWYVSSLEHISYLFPAAHGSAYCLSAVRVAFFKLHYPREFYAAWMSYRTDRYDMDTILTNDPEKYQERLKDPELGDVERGSLRMALDAITTGKVTDKQGKEYDGKTVYAHVNLEFSEPVRWRVNPEDNKTYPGISTLPNISVGIAEGIVDYRNKHEGHVSRHSKDLKDFGIRIPKKARETLIEQGYLDD